MADLATMAVGSREAIALLKDRAAAVSSDDLIGCLFVLHDIAGTPPTPAMLTAAGKADDATPAVPATLSSIPTKGCDGVMLGHYSTCVAMWSKALPPGPLTPEVQTLIAQSVTGLPPACSSRIVDAVCSGPANRDRCWYSESIRYVACPAGGPGGRAPLCRQERRRRDAAAFVTVNPAAVLRNGRAASAMAAAAAERIGALAPAVTLLVSCGLVGAVDVTSLLLKCVQKDQSNLVYRLASGA